MRSIQGSEPMTEVFTLRINVDDDAFQGEGRNSETARILRNVAARIEAGEYFDHYRTLYDVNGNDVGRAAFKLKAQL